MASHSINLTRGFLPANDPLTTLPNVFSAWEQLANDLPKMIVGNNIRQLIQSLPEFPTQHLKSNDEYERAMVILSYLGHAYIWAEQQQPATVLPHIIAQPWHQVAATLGRPPILSYQSYALYNWQRIDASQPSVLGNICLLQNFLGGIDEEWFILIHVDIEYKAIPGINALLPAAQAADNEDLPTLTKQLTTLADALTAMCTTLDRMPEYCDPYIYYNRVRPYIHGWKDNPALPDGVIYEGVSAYNEQPQKFKGETGAQSVIIPAFDAALKISHEASPLKTHLTEMQDYMPPLHRQFLQSLAAKPVIRDAVLKNKRNAPELKAIYNRCIELIGQFRATHLHYAAQYIQKQSQTSLANPSEIGTGGTPFMAYLGKHKRETEAHLID